MLQLSSEYGRGNASFEAAGGEAGIRKLIDDFYNCMRDNPDYQTIWDWHPSSGEDDANLKQESREKLARFLCGWMGGPRLYQEKYGEIQIPRVHMHLKVTAVEKEMWLSCMRDALDMQDYKASFKTYLIEQLSKPAEMIRQVCSNADST